MQYEEYRYLVLSDLYRIEGDIRRSTCIRAFIHNALFRYQFWLRTCSYAESPLCLKYIVHPFARIMHHRMTYRLGISISPRTRIGSGFFIGHFGGIVVNSESIIGKNCNISHGVTIGKSNRGENQGHPIIGDNVYIGPGAKVIGSVTIGNNVAIGANCVVTKDIPDNSVVVGNPCKIVSDKGATGYINRTDYEDKIGRQE